MSFRTEISTTQWEDLHEIRHATLDGPDRAGLTLAPANRYADNRSQVWIFGKHTWGLSMSAISDEHASDFVDPAAVLLGRHGGLSCEWRVPDSESTRI